MLQKVRRFVGLTLAGLWRRLMFRTTFIAVSGSVGKSTCKELIAQVLSTSFRTLSTRVGTNHFSGITRTILRVRPWHKFAVIEIGLDRPGQMARFARTVRPDIAVWLSVARTHQINFGDLETTAYEKSLLVEGLRRGGIAILNDDNPYIASYQPPAHVRPLYFGRTARSQWMPSHASSDWPERLSFRVTAAGAGMDVKTRLVGEHWVASVIPSLMIAEIAGIPSNIALSAISRCDPLPMRLTPFETPTGATILQDEKNASIDGLIVALEVLRNATAVRRMLVITDVTNSTQPLAERLVEIGRSAADVADAAMFIGEGCELGADAAIASGMKPDQVWTFRNTADAASCLRRELNAGDLVLLRGRRIDHLSRLHLQIKHDVRCWKNSCGKSILCEQCSELTNPRKERLIPQVFH